MAINELVQVSDKYWRARDGADHIIAMPAPVTNLRHQGSQRGFFHYMIQLTTPIFLSLEYSTTFIEEYPICSVRKNIVMPYPTTYVASMLPVIILSSVTTSLLTCAGILNCSMESCWSYRRSFVAERQRLRRRVGDNICFTMPAGSTETASKSDRP